LAISPKILIYGCGNPGRQDDGLGVFVAERIEKWIKKENIEYVKIDCNYQLNIEDAAEMADKDIIVFVDASKEDLSDYLLTRVKPSNKLEFTTHSISPSYLLNLCNVIYNRSPEVYLLHIKGYKWDFMGEITEKAKRNLGKAYNFLKKFIISNKNGIKDIYFERI